MANMHEQEFIEWIKARAEKVKERNIYESKSWLLTGTSMFPNNISLKMVCYQTAKRDRNVALSSITISSMLNSPESESHPELQKEIKSLIQSVQSDSTSADDKLNSDIFKCIPKDIQCNIVRRVALATEDIISKCSLLLLLIKTNSFYAREYGPLMIEMLFEAEIKGSPHNRNNIYRRYFVNDVLPMMLRENPAGTDKKMLLSWLDKAFQYYLVIVFQPHKEGFQSPTSSTISTSSSSKATRPWDCLAELLVLTAQQVKVWNVNAEHLKTEDSLMQYMATLKQRLAKDYSKTLKREFIYIGTYALLKLVHMYTGLTKNQAVTCLIQTTFPDVPATPKKHKKSSVPVTNINHAITAAKNIQNGDSLVSIFKSACTVWSMLHSDSSYSKGFTEFLDRLDYPVWKASLANFTKDRIVYQQEYKSYPVSTEGTGENGCYLLQKACCQFALSMHKEACLEILDVITDEDISSDKGVCCHEPADDQPNCLTFTFISHPIDVFNRGIDVLISALKGRLAKDHSNNFTIGILCVLSQLHWPKYKNMLFNQIRPMITEAKKFTFRCFFDYIINVEILEEFAYLRTEQGGNVLLELQPMSAIKQRTVTRGVSRDAQEDIKAAFEKQVARSSECVHQLVNKFLIEKKDEIIAAF